MFETKIVKESLFVHVFVVALPLTRNGGKAEDHGPPEAGYSQGPGPEVVEKQSRQKASSANSLQLDSAERDDRFPERIAAGAA